MALIARYLYGIVLEMVGHHLGELEQLVLLAILRLGEQAYGVMIRAELEAEASRKVDFGTIYKTLKRLQRKGYVVSQVGEPTAERGGRRKKFYRLEPLGAQAITLSMKALWRLNRGLRWEWENS